MRYKTVWISFWMTMMYWLGGALGCTSVQEAEMSDAAEPLASETSESEIANPTDDSVVEQDVVLEDFAPEDVAQEDVVQEDVVRDDFVNEQVIQEDVGDENNGLQNAVQEDDDIWREPETIMQAGVVPDDVAHENVMHQDFVQEDFGQEHFGQEAIAPDAIVNQEVIHEDVGDEDNVGQSDVQEDDHIWHELPETEPSLRGLDRSHWSLKTVITPVDGSTSHGLLLFEDLPVASDTPEDAQQPHMQLDLKVMTLPAENFSRVHRDAIIVEENIIDAMQDAKAQNWSKSNSVHLLMQPMKMGIDLATSPIRPIMEPNQSDAQKADYGGDEASQTDSEEHLQP